MVERQPRSRRPIAQIFRRTGDGATKLCLRLGIPPDAISYLSILAALAAALCFWKSGRNAWLLIIAPLFCYLRLWVNMLDGMVAVAAGKGGGERRDLERPAGSNLRRDYFRRRCAQQFNESLNWLLDGNPLLVHRLRRTFW